jgi:hypothetical protein
MGVVRYLISTGAALGPSYGSAARAREWYREFREVVLMSLVYNIKRLAKPRILSPYSDSMEPNLHPVPIR